MKKTLTLIFLSLIAAITVYATPPVNLEKPEVSVGGYWVGNVAVTTTGIWDHSNYTFTYQWYYFNGFSEDVISGETGASYTITSVIIYEAPTVFE